MFQPRNPKPVPERIETAGRAGRATRLPRAREWFTLAAAGTIGACLFAAPAQAAPSQSSTLTATVAVAQQFKSVTLSSTNETFANCTGGSSTPSTLGFPNGTCNTPVFTLTNNGTVPEGIDMQAGAMIPSDNGTSWTLVPGDPRAGPVGGDEYALGNINQIWLSGTPQLDPNAGAAMQPNTTVSDDLNLEGPSASTDASPSFSTSVLYTAF